MSGNGTPGAQAAGELVLKVYEGPRVVAQFTVLRSTEIGRRETHDPVPYAKIERPSDDRIVLAEMTETNVSRRHLRVEPRGATHVSLRNESSIAHIALPGNRRLAPGETLEVELPIACELGSKVVHLDWRPADDNLRSLMEPTLAPGSGTMLGSGRIPKVSVANLEAIDSKTNPGAVLAWIQATMEVFQSAAGSEDFLKKAVMAAAEMVNLDTVAVVLKPTAQQGLRWSVAAVYPPVADNWRPSETILQRVADMRHTFFHAIPQRQGIAASLVGVQSIIAAPILDANSDLIGALYGEGRSKAARERELKVAAPLTDIEAKLFELLAYGVATGLARLAQERKLIAERVRFEQFFTPELARELQSRGDEMLATRDADVTVMFCDIKGFSRVSSRTGMKQAIDWVREVLSEISDCVAEHDGVLVDYGGDSLEALWGAPLVTPDHALQACRAAIAMRRRLPALSDAWQERLGQPTEISIGINSGLAQVGNIGSRRKFKYGAFGTTVNLASRIQGATKHLGASILASHSTVQAAKGDFAFRRLATVRTVNIIEPVELYEMVPERTPAWDDLRKRYELAYSLFERGRFVEAMGHLGKLFADFPNDDPTRKLLQRNVAMLGTPQGSFDPVWNLDAK
ncbi:MAG: Adenylate cyclase 2 [Planctomycetota bacterium]|jgi:adenylate cyclase